MNEPRIKFVREEVSASGPGIPGKVRHFFPFGKRWTGITPYYRRTNPITGETTVFFRDALGSYVGTVVVSSRELADEYFTPGCSYTFEADHPLDFWVGGWRPANDATKGVVE